MFLFLTAVYLLSYSGGFHSIDEVSAVAMTESLVKHGRVTTDQIWWSQNWTPSQGRFGPDGHLYSKKGLGVALLGAPFYRLALVLGPGQPLPEVGTVRALMLANALVTALTGWLLYSCVRLLGYRPVVAVLTAMGYGLGTMAWPYAKYFFGGPMAALGLMVGLWGLLATGQTGRARYAVVAGTGLGLALLVRVASAVTWPLYVAYVLWVAFGQRSQREAILEGGGRRPVALVMAFLLPLSVAVLALAVYNAARTGHWLDMGYTPLETFSTPLWQGLAGLLLSPGKSLFLFSPLLLAALLGTPALLRGDRATALLSLGVATVYTLLHAGWYMWWGGWSWGPRFLVPILPFLGLFLAPVLDWVLRPGRWWARAMLAALALLSIWVQILGVAVDFNRYLLLLYQVGLDHGEINFRAELSPLLGHWALLREGVALESLRLDAHSRGSAGLWDVAWARNLARGVDWPLLLLPLALLAGALIGWYIFRKMQAETGWVGRVGRWLLAVTGIGLLGVALVTVARLPAAADDWQAGSQALSGMLQEAAGPEDIVIVDLLPYADHLGLATSLLGRYKAAPAYWGWARQEPISAERQVLLAKLGAVPLGHEHRRLWLALDTTPEADPASTTERWLDENAFRVESRWLSPAMRLVRYELPAGSLDEDPQTGVDLRLGDRLWLEGYSLTSSDHLEFEVHAGDVLAFSLFWRAEQPVEEDYVVFVQLLDQDGRLQAQVDRPPVGGFRPTSTWQPGELIRDNLGVELPLDLSPGDYQLIAGLYLPATMERLVVSTTAGVQPDDYVLLDIITVVGGDGP